MLKGSWGALEVGQAEGGCAGGAWALPRHSDAARVHIRRRGWVVFLPEAVTVPSLYIVRPRGEKGVSGA